VLRVDLNCDMGESFGVYRLGHDAELLKCVTSANIACGFHAGDPATMHTTVRLALNHGVAIGAHPGLNDLAGFGRREMKLAPQDAYDLVVYQVGALMAFAKTEGGELRHVKPHGALYNMAAVNPELAQAIASAVSKVDASLVLLGLSGSELLRAGQAAGLRTASEVFADRAYEQDGTLTPRTRPDSIITDPHQATQRVIRMIKEGRVRSRDGHDIPLQADSVCIHGDAPHAAEFARQLRADLEQARIAVRALG
jgi:UPF0271 protein